MTFEFQTNIVPYKIRALETLTKEKLMRTLKKPMSPKFPDAKAVIDAFGFWRQVKYLYMLAQRHRVDLILEAAGISSQISFIPDDRWQQDQPWLEKKADVVTSNSRPGLYCTTLPANIGLFRFAVSLS